MWTVDGRRDSAAVARIADPTSRAHLDANRLAYSNQLALADRHPFFDPYTHASHCL
jgi:hypothetical protein